MLVRTFAIAGIVLLVVYGLNVLGLIPVRLLNGISQLRTPSPAVPDAQQSEETESVDPRDDFEIKSPRPPVHLKGTGPIRLGELAICRVSIVAHGGMIGEEFRTRSLTSSLEGDEIEIDVSAVWRSGRKPWGYAMAEPEIRVSSRRSIDSKSEESATNLDFHHVPAAEGDIQIQMHSLPADPALNHSYPIATITGHKAITRYEISAEFVVPR